MGGEGAGVDPDPGVRVAHRIEDAQGQPGQGGLGHGLERGIGPERAVQGEQAARLDEPGRGEEGEGALERAVRPDPGVGPVGERGLEQGGAVAAAAHLRAHHPLDGAVGEHAGVGDRAVPLEAEQVPGAVAVEREARRLVERGDAVVRGHRAEQIEDLVTVLL